jgi:hypothetical protein
MIAINPHCDTLDRQVKPVNLRVKYGRSHLVQHDPSYYAEYGPRATKEDPWHMVIPGRYGHIYPFGGSKLAASTNHRGSVAKRLAAMDCCEVYQDGDDGVTAIFDEGDFRKVASAIKARTTRKLSPAHRKKLVAAGAKYRRNSQAATAA